MKFSLISFGLCIAILAEAAASENNKKISLDHFDYGYWADWSSRHTSRGRDYLDGKGAFSQGIYGGLGPFGFELDRSGAIEDGTEELNFDLYYYREFESFSLAGAYEFSDWKSGDFEVDGSSLSVGATYYDLPAGLWISGEVEYSIDRDGFFSELSIGADLKVNDWLTLTPAVDVGYNSGYFDEGHDGFNHIATSFSADFFLTDHLRLTASGVYSWALNRESDFVEFPDDAILEDFFWTGLTISVGGDRERSKKPAVLHLEPWDVTLGTSTWANTWSGSLEIGSGSPGIVQPVSDSDDQLHTGLSLEATRGPWSILVEGSYVSFGAEVPPPLPIFSSSPADVRMGSVQLAAGYRAYENKCGSLDLLAGVRYHHLETEYQFGTPESHELNWFDPLVGVRGHINLLEDLSLSGRAEIGVGSDQYWQADIGLEYQLSDHISVDLRYQHLEIDYTRGNDNVHSEFKGPKIGASYRF